VKKNEDNEFNNRGVHIVTQTDLPLSCPMPKMVLWNAHPRVYLPIESTGEASCPYCGAFYILKNYRES
jgi:uncharacterized Zn-finger protein